MTTHQLIALALGLLPIVLAAVAFAVHVVRESWRLERGEPPKGIGRVE